MLESFVVFMITVCLYIVFDFFEIVGLPYTILIIAMIITAVIFLIITLVTIVGRLKK